MYTKRELKEKFGFTEGMMKKLLPEPEERPNPYYKSGAPMKLWPKSVVDELVTTDEYKRANEKAEKRRASARKATETKRAKTRAQIDEAISEIRVKCPESMQTYEGALEAGVRHKSMLDDERGAEYCGDPSQANNETKERWAVNYIRHKLTKYEKSLYDIKGKVGVNEEYLRYRAAVLDEIARCYPFLANECERQKLPYWMRFI